MAQKRVENVYANLYTDLQHLENGETGTTFDNSVIIARITQKNGVLSHNHDLPLVMQNIVEQEFSLKAHSRFFSTYYSGIYEAINHKNSELIDFFIMKSYHNNMDAINIMVIDNALFIKSIEKEIEKLYDDGTYYVAHKNSIGNKLIDIQNSFLLPSGHIVVFNHTKTNYTKNISLSFFIMGLIYLLVMIIQFFITKTAIQQPLHRLTELVTYANNKHYDLKLHNNSYKEIDELSVQIENMMLRTKDLQREIFVKDMRNIKAEIKILQSQIQPHFILNTLNTIKLLGIRGEKQQLTNTIHDLADLLQYGVYEPSKLATIAEELKMIESYISIMQKRFDKEILVTSAIPTEFKNRKVLKLLLQPIIENTLKHNYASEKPIHISINMLKKIEYLDIEITDNGKGISNSELMEIKRKISNPKSEYKTGIGLVNTHHRIQMEHGDAYGISISSKENIGTTVKIIIPDII